MRITEVSKFDANDLATLFDECGYSSIVIDTAEYVGYTDQHIAVFNCTAPDDSGIDDILSFKVFVSVKPNGELEVEF